MEEGIWAILKQAEVIWFFIGLSLMLGEFVLPGLIIVFFGVGCWVTSLTLMVFPSMNLTIQMLIFLGSSILLLILVRNKAKGWINQSASSSGTDELLEEFIGRKAITEVDFNDMGEGKIVFKGTSWEAECDQPLKKGAAVMIIAKESIKLIVKPLK